jgi:YjbE family integral membrane protein
MEILSMEFVVALLAIIMIDLVLAGDNAVVIGLAARNLPKEKQKVVIIWGTIGAIAIRVLATFAVVWLLKIPGLLLVGGLLLIWIAYKLLVQEKKHDAVASESTILRAIGTIILADTVMGVDNVIAVAGAAHGDFLLIILGLLISVPIMVFGSTLVIFLTDKYPIVIYIGAGVLVLTAGKMIMDEPMLETAVKSLSYGKWVIIALITGAVLAAGKFKKQKKLKQLKLELEV